MSMVSWSMIFALLANLTFSSASLVYTAYSQRFSALWMNTMKTGVALVATTLAFPIWWPLFPLDGTVIIVLMLSGFVGLMLGDWFLLGGFSKLGAGPVLMLFAFQPLMLAAWESEFFEGTFTFAEIGAMGCLIGCLILFSMDQKKRTDSWNLPGFVLGMAAVALDALGVVLSKWVFESYPDFSPGQSHLFRCAGALLGFAVVWNVAPRRYGFWAPFKGLSLRAKQTVVGASFIGTFLSLLFYLWALKWGEMALVSSVAVTGPLFASFLEHVVRRAWPTLWMWLATALFLLGFSLLVLFANY